jgi:hypothetical protein
MATADQGGGGSPIKIHVSLKKLFGGGSWWRDPTGQTGKGDPFDPNYIGPKPRFRPPVATPAPSSPAPPIDYNPGATYAPDVNYGKGPPKRYVTKWCYSGPGRKGRHKCNWFDKLLGLGSGINFERLAGIRKGMSEAEKDAAASNYVLNLASAIGGGVPFKPVKPRALKGRKPTLIVTNPIPKGGPARRAIRPPGVASVVAVGNTLRNVLLEPAAARPVLRLVQSQPGSGVLLRSPDVPRPFYSSTVAAAAEPISAPAPAKPTTPTVVAPKPAPAAAATTEPYFNEQLLRSYGINPTLEVHPGSRPATPVAEPARMPGVARAPAKTPRNAGRTAPVAVPRVGPFELSARALLPYALRELLPRSRYIGPGTRAISAISAAPGGATQPIRGEAFGLSPFAVPQEALNRKCKCNDKKKKREPRRGRTECWKGSYVETARGLRKTRRERVPC